MRLGRSTTASDILASAGASVQTSGITKGEGETVRGPHGTTATMNGPIGTERTATVTDSNGRTIGTVQVDQNCIVTGTTPA